MPRITYIDSNNDTHDLDVPAGLSVMEGAVKNGVPGIDADCGGACACATCHVFVDEGWLARLPEQSPMEEQMLEFAGDVLPNSRLACQLPVTDALDGLRVTIPQR